MLGLKPVLLGRGLDLQLEFMVFKRFLDEDFPLGNLLSCAPAR